MSTSDISHSQLTTLIAYTLVGTGSQTTSTFGKPTQSSHVRVSSAFHILLSPQLSVLPASCCWDQPGTDKDSPATKPQGANRWDLGYWASWHRLTATNTFLLLGTCYTGTSTFPFPLLKRELLCQFKKSKVKGPYRALWGGQERSPFCLQEGQQEIAALGEHVSPVSNCGAFPWTSPA